MNIERIKIGIDRFKALFLARIVLLLFGKWCRENWDDAPEDVKNSYNTLVEIVEDIQENGL